MDSQDPTSEGTADFQSDLQRVKQAYVNEKVAPDILEYDEELVDRLQQRLAQQEERVGSLEAHWSVEIERSMYLLEAERLKYLLACYLRTRLKKVQKYAMLCLEQARPGGEGSPPTHPCLSRQELTFAQEYFFMMGMHMKDNVLSKMPIGYEQLVKQHRNSTEKDTMPMPDLNHHVFCKVLEDRGTVELDEEGLETAQFEQGDLYVVRYKPIQDLLKDKWITMI